jgi:fructosamine-3-kinase
LSLRRGTLDALAAALGAPPGSARPGDVRAVSGGCVSPAWRVTVAGTPVFVKTAPAGGPEGMLAAEATSLAAIRATNAIRVPAVLAAGADWLALEWLEPGPGSAADWAQLGRRLAALHRVQGQSWGWPEDNFIGPLPQANGALGRWSEFWLERRLMPQFDAAAPRLGAAARRDFAALARRLPRLLDEAADGDGPSLLHGDLWGGNVHMTLGAGGIGAHDNRGAPAGDTGALIDPSSAYGHREVDLAMATLFGGFEPSFFAAYEAEWPLADGAADRRAVYQLYYLLVHVNLFGGSYVPATERVLAG